jgi:thiamine pyrophosphokinase
MTKFAILLGGDVVPTRRLHQQLDGARAIAADSGMAHAAVLKLVPEVWVGDFDSAGTALAESWNHIPRQIFPADKDASDGEIAITEALRRGATEIILVGGFGGQFDHVLSHAAMMLALAKRAIPCLLTSGTEEAQALSPELVVTGLAAGTRLSIVPLSDLKALSMSGVKYQLHNRDVVFGTTLTLSNVATGDVAISLRAGTGLVIAYPKDVA